MVYLPVIINYSKIKQRVLIGWRQGGRWLQGNLWYSPPASMTSLLASVTFKMASKLFTEETDKSIVFITEILFRFLGFGDFKVSIVIENYTSVLFWNEMSSKVRILKISFYRRANFSGNHTDRSPF